MDITNWKFYYNIENNEFIRANLVYTPYVSPDNKIFCMSFNRDIGYHFYPEENTQWSEQDLTQRFETELKFHQLAKINDIPTLEILDVDKEKRQIFIEWPGDDFFMLGITQGGYDKVLSNWQEQWVDIILKLKKANISKISLHPNSFVVKNKKLIPFNWFFCYERTQENIDLNSLLKQISSGRLEKLISILNKYGLNLNSFLSAEQFQVICFESFRNNYPKDLIDKVINNLTYGINKLT